jgi:hypothetical protein
MGEGGRIELGRAQIAAPPASGLARTFGLCLNRPDHGQVGERHLSRVTPVREQPGHVVADGVTADLDPAMLAVGGGAGLDVARRRVAEEGLHVLEGGKTCCGRFDDLTGTVLAGHHQRLRVWVLCLYFMGLNLPNRQIARALGLSQPDVQLMTEQLRTGLVARTPPAQLGGEVEIDEVYVVAGHKGNPAAVIKRGARDDAGG